MKNQRPHLIFVISAWIFGAILLCLEIGREEPLQLIFLAILLCLFSVMSYIDLSTHRIYDMTLWSMLGICAAMLLYRHIFCKVPMLSHLVGGAVGFAFFFLIRYFAKRITGRECLGEGDVYLAGIGGLFLGPMLFLFAVITATLPGALIEALRQKICKRSPNTEIAFAPYLLFGFWIMALYGEGLLSLYWEVLL